MLCSRSVVVRFGVLVASGFGSGRAVHGSELSSHLLGQESVSVRQMAAAWVRSLGDPPVGYWVVGLSLFGLLVVVSLLPWVLRPSPDGSPARGPVRVLLDRRLFGLLATLTLTALRWPVLARTLMNTDEAHSIACALKLAVDPVFWRGIDGTTGGPLLYYPLLLPKLLGLSLEYASARLVGLAALIGSVLLLYGVLRRWSGEGVARVAVLPLVASWGLTTSSHFAHYSSEQIPVLLITLALYLLVRFSTEDEGATRWLILAGLVLGSLPFAKLQSVPIGLYLAICGFVMIARRSGQRPADRRRTSLAFLGSGLVVPAAFSLVSLATGVWRDFWQSYVLNNLGYGGRYQQLGEVAVPLYRKVWAVIDRMFWTFDLAEMVGPLMAFGALSLVAAAVLDRSELRRQMGRIGLAVGLLGVSIVAVATPNTLFTHYFLFLALPAALVGAVSLDLATTVVGARFSGRARGTGVALVLVVFLGSTAVRLFEHRLGRPHRVFSSAESLPAIDGDGVAEIALAFSRPGEPLAVWGWQPWRFVETGLHPATRDTQTQWQILDTPQRLYYQERFRRDLLASMPPVFIDTVGYVEDPSTPWRPVFWDRETQAHDVFPQIGQVIRGHYREVADLEGSRIYVAEERLARLERAMGTDLVDRSPSELRSMASEMARLDLTEQASPEEPIDR